ncbi:electron transfer flavoprotein subunit alpha/FixB family protein [Ornithinimicrobium faecis]|uniref:Electron transfer flavoprotein subunit alpha/FixB family protein n=1 Tax=Ornithinimicrobium faecis TaxID=2934158 RepID=A0ABY4YS32_9MICO|nr:electron transfer flavoprotein subunit alpha/FixB family protein [Ornithinimicrobium sp. HY1793]USQ79305.1 electron transfer flavoprotein subunit alpha/FixB family protein [Ornithinimicrobium sp. HY1793]
MAEVLVLVDHVDGNVRKTTAEMLTAAARLGEPSAVFVGTGFETAKDALAQYGAAKVYRVEDAAVTDHLVAPTAEVLAQLVSQTSPAAVLLPSSSEGKEIGARLAIKTESGLITDAVDVQAGDGGAVRTVQSVFAGSYTVTSSVSKGSPIITVKPNSIPVQEAAGAAADEVVSVSLSEGATAAKIVDRKEKAASGRPQLTEAAIVVSGGRGTGGDFNPVEAFADSLGAAVGASRAAVDAGWYPHANQVGQTGVQVSPQLYVAAGISGAIQHRAGMQTSKTIVAVNKDPEAPIFELVDYGVVGDLFQVLPQATAEVQARKG